MNGFNYIYHTNNKDRKKWAKYLTQELGGKKDYRRNPKKEIIKDRNKINNKSVLN